MILSYASCKVLFLMAAFGVCILTGLNMKAKEDIDELKHEVVSLRGYKEHTLLEKAAIGLQLPDSLQTALRRASYSTSEESQLSLIYFVSAFSCRPCVQEDIEVFRKLVQRKGGCLRVFFAGPGLSNREFLGIKSFFDVNFPVTPISFDPSAMGIDKYPTTILADRQSVILFQAATLAQDTMSASISRLAFYQLVENLSCK